MAYSCENNLSASLMSYHVPHNTVPFSNTEQKLGRHLNSNNQDHHLTAKLQTWFHVISHSYQPPIYPHTTVCV